MQCTECNSELRQVPAGVSRSTGKHYKAFWACPNRCRQALQQKQPQNNGKQNAAVEMIYLLQEIRDTLNNIDLKLGKKDVVKDMGSIPIVEETGAPEPEGGYPY